MHVERYSTTLTTDASGDVTGYITAPGGITGKLVSLIYAKDSFANGSTFLITSDATGQALWGETAVNASAVRSPRQSTHDTAGAESLYAGGGRPVEDYLFLARDRIKVVVSSGGNAKSGTFTAIIA